MPQVEGWRLESGEQCFSSADFFLTFGHVADPSVLACFLLSFSFLGECGDRKVTALHQNARYLWDLGQVASSLGALDNKYNRTVVGINYKW